MGVTSGRISTDGTSGPGAVNGQQAHLIAFSSRPPVAPGAPVLNTSGPIPSGALDSESDSDGSVTDTSADQNEGRRASDTVLYAAAALKEAKNRLDKASNMIPARQTSQQEKVDTDGASTAHVSLPALECVGSHNKPGRGPGGSATVVGVARRPSKGSLRLPGSDATVQGKRDEAALEAVPE
ncbi:hypothetical protein GPECTOR_1g595 [Gonium pectorale]|uniref:Uncharacterized protein n=1 Tax=Gonium pectorale TaxID=33097 RepID=A0A150H4X2_GONPE|nr:hypothetical protein GPECTOR_1g595 [Gonium pectorale]|eukprot:KXZ56660.1 hypothetical protein GPECTOR_1g595 [Gonium pectorale]